jgi:uncharacterized phage-associated protein
MKLQKLCYYCQAWTLAWEDNPLFDDDFQAWAGGPVNPDLYYKHRGIFTLRDGFFGEYDDSVYSNQQKENMDMVIGDYGLMTPFEISDLTHQERPWIEARGSTPAGERSTSVISKESMQQYYSGLIA